MSRTPNSTLTTETSLPTAGTWAIDPSHSSVEAVARHLMVTKVRGRFGAVAGTVHVDEDLSRSRVSVELEAASVDTRDEQRDAHLRSADFLDADTYPTLRFESDEVVVDGDRWTIPGRLTIRDVTRDVTLDVDYLGLHLDPWGNRRAAFSARTEIDREAFGMTWNQALESGGVLVSKKLKIELDVQLVQQDDQE